MTKLVLCLNIFLLSGCISNSIKPGLYMNTCRLYDMNSVKLKINPDHTFEYFFAYNEERVIGGWNIKRDTLFLVSEKFNEKRGKLQPKIKNTDQIGKDVYLIRGRRLKIINITGVTKDCFFKRSN